jgi:hypothetical protein
MSHYGWYVNSARWAFEDIADLLGIDLEPVDVPHAGWSPHSATFDHLLAGLGNRGPQLTVADHERAKLYRVARHLRIVNEIGDELLHAELDDAARLLGERPEPQALDARLVEFIATDRGAHDDEIVRLLDRRVQRLHLVLGPPGSMMLRHPRLRSVNAAHAHTIRGAADDLPWTPGLIAGTR